MLTNHKPIVRGTTKAIWRRLRLVPFDVVVPDDERDGNLPNGSRLELDGILAWLFAGLRSGRPTAWPTRNQVTAATDSVPR